MLKIVSIYTFSYLIHSFKGEKFLSITEMLVKADDFMYLYVLIICLIVVGVILSVKTRFVQMRLFPESFKVVMEKSEDEEAISSF